VDIHFRSYAEQEAIAAKLLMGLHYGKFGKKVVADIENKNLKGEGKMRVFMKIKTLKDAQEYIKELENINGNLAIQISNLEKDLKVACLARDDWHNKYDDVKKDRAFFSKIISKLVGYEE